jgi:hypothetical protein
MPEHVKAAWHLARVGERTLCDSTLLCTIRALATRTSWASAAAVFNELRATRHAQRVRLYVAICSMLQLQPAPAPDNLFRVTARWVSDLYEHDYEARAPDIAMELLAEVPGHILAVDWTRDAAARCSGRWMFNAMDSHGKILASILTATTSPNEVAPVLREMHSRGVQPKAVYVDDECCGAWKDVVGEVWPGAAVVLDAFHAIRRLTQTTTSPRHPWHKHFCRLLSDAIFECNADLSARFRRACSRGKVPPKLAKKLKKEYVDRRVRGKKEMEMAIDGAIADYTGRQHLQAGPLLTAKTFAAWDALKRHVHAGCLGDPQGVDLNIFSDQSVTIGGEIFRKPKVARGSSALEGFHTHQKSWLGAQVHSRKRGLALVADGTARFNRKRRNNQSQPPNETPPVFAAGLLVATNPPYKQFIEDGARRLQAASVTNIAAPVRAASDSDLHNVKEWLDKLSGNQSVLAEKHGPLCGTIGAECCSHPRPPAKAGEDDLERDGVQQEQAQPKKHQRRTAEDKVPMRAVLSGSCSQAGADMTPQPAPTPRSGCRTCRMIGTKCRRHYRVQWCETNDAPFDEWVLNTFPSKKAESRTKSARAAARVGGSRGRPKKRALCADASGNCT